MKKTTELLVTSVLLASLPNIASALSPTRMMAACASDPLSNFFGFQPWYACLPKNDAGEPAITKLSDLFLIIFPVVEWLVKAGALVAAGIIFFLLIQMVIARGDAGKIATAVSGIRDAVIGFVICLISIAIVNFISGAFV